MATLCMALRHGDDTHLIADRMITDSAIGYRFLSTTPKIIPLGACRGAEVIAMVAGSIVLNTILRSRTWNFERSDEDDLHDDFETILATRFVPDLLDAHHQMNYEPQDDPVEDTVASWPYLMGSMLIIYDNTIYNICNKRSIMEMGELGAIGSSERIVYPAVKTSRLFTTDPLIIMRAALHTCVDLDPYICAPFDYALYSHGALGPIQPITDLRVFQ